MVNNLIFLFALSSATLFAVHFKYGLRNNDWYQLICIPAYYVQIDFWLQIADIVRTDTVLWCSLIGMVIVLTFGYLLKLKYVFIIFKK